MKMDDCVTGSVLGFLSVCLGCCVCDNWAGTVVGTYRPGVPAWYLPRYLGSPVRSDLWRQDVTVQCCAAVMSD